MPAIIIFKAKLRDPDCSLSERGHRQSQLLGEYLNTLKERCKEDGKFKKSNGLFNDYESVELFTSHMKIFLST